MSLWAKTLNLPSEVMDSIRQYYGDQFPIEVRHYLAQWIEENMLNSRNDQMSEYDPQYEQTAIHFLHQIIAELERRAPEFVDNLIPVQLRLSDTAKSFRQRFLHNPTSFYTHLRNCLALEVNYVNGCPQQISMVQNAEVMEVVQQLRALTMLVATNDDVHKQLQLDYERFALEYHDFTKNNAQLQNLPKTPETEKKRTQYLDNRQKNLEDLLNQLTGKRLALVDKFREVIHMTTQAQHTVLVKFLNQWKVNQGLAGNGAPFNNNLDSIQEWCESLADIIWNTKEQIKRVQKTKQIINSLEPNLHDYLPELHTQITNLLMSLVTATFVIEKQPPQVMKTNTRFTATVRLLIGAKLNIQMNSPQVKVSIVSEAQAQITQQTNKYSDVASGDILNNTGSMEYQQATKQLSVSFRNMQLKKIKRAEKKGTESVMDEKFALLFQSNFAVGHGDVVFAVWALSLPVVVIVHGNQEPQSWATITWDNAFADLNRIPFQIPEKVPWNRLAEALNMKFKSATGRALTDENLHFLCEKAFKTTLSVNPNDVQITWSQFCKEPLPERTFTFWEWFYAVMKLTREHLRGPWNDGHVLGFIHKKQAEDLLMKCPNGTFLLRFSDSELGGVTIAWVGEGNDKQPINVFMLQPFLAKDFAIRSLADRIQDLHQLVSLYLDIPKETAFGKYFTPFSDQSNNGYVKPVLVTHVPNMSNGPISYPNTPQHSSFMQSPDHSRDTPSVKSFGPASSNSVSGVNSAIDYHLMDDLSQFDMFESPNY